MYKEILTAVAIVAGLVASTAQAQEKTGRAERMQAWFAQMDTDNDGELSMDEMMERAAARFAAADTDNSGGLTLEEMRAARTQGGKARMQRDAGTGQTGADTPAKADRGARMESMFERLDADSDGEVTLAEMQARRDPAAMFARLDADGNGTLSLDEFAKARGHGKKGQDRPAD